MNMVVLYVNMVVLLVLIICHDLLMCKALCGDQGEEWKVVVVIIIVLIIVVFFVIFIIIRNFCILLH